MAAPRPSSRSKKLENGLRAVTAFRPLSQSKKWAKWAIRGCIKKVKIKNMDEGRMSRETQKPTVRVVTPLQLFATSKTGQKYVIVATDPTGGKVIKDGKIK